MLKLYDMRRSGNAYKARLMLGLLGLSYETVTVNLAVKQQLEPWFVAINPLNQVPVIDDAGTVIRDSAAVLVYLAAKYDPARTWYPADAKSMGEIQQWLAYAGNEIFHTLPPARGIGIGMRQGSLAEAQEKARGTLAFLDQSLTGRDWLLTDHPTVADVACYPYCGLIGQAKIDIAEYTAVAAWCRRMEELKGYVPVPPQPMPPDWQ